MTDDGNWAGSRVVSFYQLVRLSNWIVAFSLALTRSKIT